MIPVIIVWPKKTTFIKFNIFKAFPIKTSTNRQVKNKYNLKQQNLKMPFMFYFFITSNDIKWMKIFIVNTLENVHASRILFI